MRTIRTARLSLRQWLPEDGERVATLVGDPHVRRYFFRTRDRAASDAWLAGVKAHWDQHDFGLWAVAVPGEAEFIGFVGLVHVGPEMPFAPAVEVAWTLAPPFWGRGYAPEAARAAIAEGFDRGLPEIVALTAVQNTPSRNVMEKLGMLRDPADDFTHPSAPAGHELSRHVIHRLANPRKEVTHAVR